MGRECELSINLKKIVATYIGERATEDAEIVVIQENGDPIVIVRYDR